MGGERISLDNNEIIEEIYGVDHAQGQLIPLLQARISAGFPSSAENYLEKSLDLNELLIKHPAATFFVRVKGDSMINAGIRSQDILIVDRALSVSHNRIVVARLHDELTIKRIVMHEDKLFLMPDNAAYKPIEITADTDFEIWGVVTYVIHQL
jgi:DNA polymerase V